MKISIVDYKIKTDLVYKMNHKTFVSPGELSGEINTEFEGKYKIRSYEPNGDILYELDFEIIINENYHAVNWIKSGDVASTVMGNLFESSL